MDEREIRELSIDTIRGLAMDSVQKANAGHPGTAMALAPLAYTIFERFLHVNPQDTDWPDRDRFVLSSGHACVLQYSLLHLCGYDLSLEDLKQFRQWGSRTPGHPERGHTPGIEITTGPLGQGVGNAVGMAIAERFLAERFNRPGHELVDHRTYAICSDGDLMEGISQEAASIAGHFGLGKLTLCYDDNRITIDGTTALSFDSESHVARFAAEGWHVQRVRGRRGRGRADARAAGGARTRGAAVVHLDPLAHRLPRAQRRRHRQVAWLGARRRRGARDQGSDGLRPRQEVLGRRARVRAHVAARQRRGGAGRVAAASCTPRGARPSRRWPPTGTSRGRASCATAGSRRCRSSTPARRSPRARPGRRRWRRSPSSPRR